jgi:DNA-binding transcriptional LysR family regulator
MGLTLRQIDAFRAVMLTGTATEAAQVLGISQPAISRLVSDLEQEIGFKLFDRVGRRVVPTAEAQILIEEVKRALTGLDQIRETASEIGRFRYSRLRLISIPSVASTVVVDLIKLFSLEYPETFVSLEVQASDAAVEWVVSQQCDLGIATPAIESPAFATSSLMVGVSRCILPPGHPLGKRDVITPRDLEGESFVSFRPDSIYRAKVDAIFQKASVNRVMQYEARTTEAICSMVAAGLGVSVVGPLGISHMSERADERLLIRHFKPAPKVDLSLMWSTHRPLPAVAQKFMELIGSYFEKLSHKPPERP